MATKRPKRPKHRKGCAVLRIGKSAWCDCGALGSTDEQLLAWKRSRALLPGKTWRVQGMKSEADVKPLGNFDEIVVGHWLHVEMMDNRSAFVQLGDRCFWLYLPKSGDVRITHEEYRP